MPYTFSMVALQKFRVYVASAFWMLALSCVFESPADEAEKLQQQFTSEIRPLLEQKCGGCHWGQEANAGIAFDRYQNLGQILDDDRQWSGVAEELESESMPPDPDSISERERQQLLDWIEATFKLVDCSTIHPGNVTIRRLNRFEYRNTIRDLLGVEYEPADDFPGDDVGHGFDNVADVMSLPPVLMERYLDAAEAVTAMAIVDKQNLPLNVNLSGTTFQSDHDHTRTDQGRLSMYTVDTASKQIRFPAAGRYRVTITAYGDQAGKEPVKMTLLIDDRPIKTAEVKSRYRKPSTHQFEMELSNAGRHEVQIRFENDFFLKRAVAPQDRNLHVNSVAVAGPLPPENLPEFLRLDGRSEAKVVNSLVEEFLPRVFRRPLTVSQRQKFASLFKRLRKKQLPLVDAARGVAQAALVSPEFLFRIEQPIESGVRTLDDFELATSLSYFLWSSTPDDQLLSLAKAGKLSNDDTLHAQIERMLQDEKSSSLVDSFAVQWLNLRVLSGLQPDPAMFPDVDQELLQAMATETRMLVADVFRNDASVLELLEAEYTFVDRELARHYGLSELDELSSGFQKISLAGSERSGILTHASILSLTSNPNRTSPVKRGKWILENVLGEVPPAAPPDIVPLDEQKELTGTLRERMQQHRADPSCASCHTTMDALGFTLENFDAVGRFRELDEGIEIDATGELPDGTMLDGLTGLREHLSTTAKEKFIRCFTEKLLVYALGRGVKYYDRCTVQQIMKQAEQQDYRFSAFIHAVASSETFRRRSAVHDYRTANTATQSDSQPGVEP